MNKYELKGSWKGLDFILWHWKAIEGVLNRTVTFGLTFENFTFGMLCEVTAGALEWSQRKGLYLLHITFSSFYCLCFIFKVPTNTVPL